jgi:hypothetical protein
LHPIDTSQSLGFGHNSPSSEGDYCEFARRVVTKVIMEYHFGLTIQHALFVFGVGSGTEQKIKLTI